MAVQEIGLGRYGLTAEIQAGDTAKPHGCRSMRLVLSCLCLTEIACIAAPGRVHKGAVQVLSTPIVTETVTNGLVSYKAWRAEERLAQPSFDVYSGDEVSTGREGRALVRWNDGETVTLGPFSRLRIPEEDQGFFADLVEGVFHFLSRDKPSERWYRSRHAVAGSLHTEFVVTVEPAETRLTVIEGRAGLSNGLGHEFLERVYLSGAFPQAVAKENGKPEALPGVSVTNLVQWWLYYPAIISLDDLGQEMLARPDLEPSLRAYAAGDVRRAALLYPATHPPVGDAELLYVSALRLALGDTAEAARLAEAAKSLPSVARAVMTLIAALQNVERSVATNLDVTASELLARSYYFQARHDLETAQVAVEEAIRKQPNFGLARLRRAELYFGAGFIEQAAQEVEFARKKLHLENAQLYTLEGFLAIADNRKELATRAFDEAIALDAAYPDAWLGHGMCRIYAGNISQGLADLEVAVALEPSRALLHSYLGKAFQLAHALALAEREFKLSRRLDPQDPTSWFYSALLEQQCNRINESIRDLEASIERNDNRMIYRSRSLLDQDRAVRGANLAAAYRDAGMTDWSVWEATQATESDYANYSAHLFLANSYNALRDPNLVNLRYETATFTEYLLAGLLSPVGSVSLSPSVSLHEYSRLFEQQGLGFSVSTASRSDGQVQTTASQSGFAGSTQYSVDGLYRISSGDFSNTKIELLGGTAQMKQQIGASDVVYFQASLSKIDSGDPRQHYAATDVDPTLHIEETSGPIALAGYRHEWQPGSVFLALGGWLHDDYTFKQNDSYVPVFLVDSSGSVTNEFTRGQPATFFGNQLDSSIDMFTAEIQQIWRSAQERLTLIGGLRGQFGSVSATSQLNPKAEAVPVYGTNLIAQSERVDTWHLSPYAYANWRVVSELFITAGLAYDWLRLPANVSSGPITGQQREESRLSPKLGLVWNITSNTTFHTAFSHSLGGAFLESSVRLEPVHIAGFNQAYRSLFPESLVGYVPGSRFQLAGVGVNQQFQSWTYVGCYGQWLQTRADQQSGVFTKLNDTSVFPPPMPGQITSEMEYTEKALNLFINQLIAKEWSLGAAYRLTSSHLDREWQGVPSNLSGASRQDESLLHQVNLYAIYNHSSGLFGQLEGLWTSQHNTEDASLYSSDPFWQFNIYFGYRYRSWRHTLEVTLGGLNLTDQDYRLYPLSPYPQLPRGRAFALSLYFGF